APPAALRRRRLGDLGEDRIAEPGPRLLRPVAEPPVGEDPACDSRVRIDPEKRAARAEVAERPLGVARARPVWRLRVAQLEGEAPIVRLHPTEAGQDAVEAGKLDAPRLAEGLGRDESRLEKLAPD